MKLHAIENGGRRLFSKGCPSFFIGPELAILKATVESQEYPMHRGQHAPLVLVDCYAGPCLLLSVAVNAFCPGL